MDKTRTIDYTVADFNRCLFYKFISIRRFDILEILLQKKVLNPYELINLWNRLLNTRDLTWPILSLVYNTCYIHTKDLIEDRDRIEKILYDYIR